MVETVLVTGASGFVAAEVLNAFLEAGFNVRGTVRSESSAEKVRQTHAKYVDQLSFAIVPDIAAPGAFNEAVKGVDGVIHTASPFILNATDFEKQLYTPARVGTTSILKATKEHNPKVKRVVITESFACVVDPTKGLRPGYVYTEKDYIPLTPETANDAVTAYLVSKKIAEEAAHDFVENEKPNFSVTSLLPPMVYGPLGQSVSSLSHLNESSTDIYNLINGKTTEVPPTAFWAFADVRDLGVAHLKAYTTEAAGNQRYLISSGSYSYQQIVDIIREKFPDLVATTPKGNAGEPLPPVYKLDTSKSKNELGLTYRSLETTIVDTVKSLLEHKQRLAAASA